jgi:hypothetical protein
MTPSVSRSELDPRIEIHPPRRRYYIHAISGLCLCLTACARCDDTATPEDIRFCRKLRKDRHSIGSDRRIGSPWPLSSQSVELVYEAGLRNRAHLSLADHLDDLNTLEGGMCAVEGFEAKCRSRF